MSDHNPYERKQGCQYHRDSDNCTCQETRVDDHTHFFGPAKQGVNRCVWCGRSYAAIAKARGTNEKEE